MEAEIEALKEENHRLNLKIGSMVQQRNVEVEFLKDELALKDKEIKNSEEKLKTEHRSRERDLNDRVQGLNDELSQTREEIENLKSQNEKLQKSLDHSKITQSERIYRLDNIDVLKQTNTQLTQDLKLTQQLLEGQQAKMSELTRMNDDYRKTITMQQEDIENKELYISQMQKKMKDLEREHQEDIMALQSQIIQHNPVETGDPNKRGNSLFSEVEERRVKVEEEMKRLRERSARLSAENTELHYTIEKGDFRSGIISNQLNAIHKGEIELVNEMKKLKSDTFPLFDTYRERMERLREEYRRKLLKYMNNPESIGEAELGELETLRGERDQLLLNKIGLERELVEYRKELKYSKQQALECDAHLKITRIKLKNARERIEKLEKDLSPSAPAQPVNLNTFCESPNSPMESRKASSDLKRNAADLSLDSPSSTPTGISNKSRATEGEISQREEISDCKQQ